MGLLLAACSKPGVVLVTVDANPAVAMVSTLRVVATVNGQPSQPLLLPLKGAPVDIPPKQTFSLEFDQSRSGPLTVKVEALDSGDRLLASSTGTGEVSRGRSQDINVTLSGSGTFDMAPPDLVGADLTTVPDLKPCVSASCPLAAPVCRGGVCAGCLTKPDCADHPSAPVCKSDGACVQCVLAADCAATQQTCDTSTNVCGSCRDHGDCTSGICDQGQCILTTDIIHVDSGSVGCMTTGEPFCSLQKGVDAAKAGSKKFVLVGKGSYPGLVINNFTTPITLVGGGTKPWDSLFTGASTLNGNTSDIGVEVSGGSVVTMDGFEITMSAGGALCWGSSKLTLRRSWVHGIGNGKAGVTGDNCAALTLDADQIGPSPSLSGGGIDIKNMTKYSLTNSFVVGNVGTIGPGVRIDASSTGIAQFLTIADNSYNPSLIGGFDCGFGVDKVIEASIVVGNSMKSATQIAGNCLLVNVVAGTDAFAGAIDGST